MRAFILDDELASAEALLILIQRYCPTVEVVALETDANVALEKVRQLRPDLLFLDINLESITGFDFVVQLKGSYGIIFTTAYQEYAYKAYEIDAIDYLIKPVVPAALVRAVEKAKQRLSPKRQEAVRLSPTIPLRRISVPVAEGLLFIDLEEVVRFEAEGSYTRVVRLRENDLLLSKNLAAMEKMTQYSGFARIHRSHLVNTKHIVKYFKGEGGELLMTNGDRVPVARNRRDDFLDNVG